MVNIYCVLTVLTKKIAGTKKKMAVILRRVVSTVAMCMSLMINATVVECSLENLPQ